MSTNKYYYNLETAETEIERLIAKVTPTDEYDSVNYSQLLFNLNNSLFEIRKMKNMHKFFKLSKEDFIRQIDSEVLKQQQSIHTVREYETPLTIAEDYNISLDELLKINNASITDFTPGATIKVPVTNETRIRIFENIPTYGSHEGSKVLGNDLPNELRADTDGDLLVLDNYDTLKQGILNRITTKQGNYPLEPDFGIDNYVGSDQPEELSGALRTTSIIAQIEQDARIEKITEYSETQKNNSTLYSIKVSTITNEEVSLENA